MHGKIKERLFELIEEVWVDNSSQLGNCVFYFERKNSCLKINREVVAPIHESQSNNEEADTKICYPLHHALLQNSGQETVGGVCSNLGDTDIPIILLANECDNLKVLTDNATGKARQLFDIASCDLSRIQQQTLLGLRAFSGHDLHGWKDDLHQVSPSNAHPMTFSQQKPSFSRMFSSE